MGLTGARYKADVPGGQWNLVAFATRRSLRSDADAVVTFYPIYRDGNEVPSSLKRGDGIADLVAIVYGLHRSIGRLTERL